MPFEPGDLVRLKSGSTLMTVESVGATMTSENMVFCVWTENNRGRQEVLRDAFPPIVLENSSKSKSGTIKLSRG